MNEIQITNLDRDTKRFLAAAMAMQGLLADSNVNARAMTVAEASVDYADELLKALEKSK